MKSSSSDSGLPLPQPSSRGTAAQANYFCDEPWTGLFSVETNLDVTFCPCYLKLKIGNLNEGTLKDIWNADPLVRLRESFERGELPDACKGQLCPVALGQG